MGVTVDRAMLTNIKRQNTSNCQLSLDDQFITSKRFLGARLTTAMLRNMLYYIILINI